MVVDLVDAPWLVWQRKGSPMDVDDLISRLCVMAGIIMEDASVGAISVSSGQHERVADLVDASELIQALASAAALLNCHFGGSEGDRSA